MVISLKKSTEWYWINYICIQISKQINRPAGARRHGAIDDVRPGQQHSSRTMHTWIIVGLAWHPWSSQVWIMPRRLAWPEWPRVLLIWIQVVLRVERNESAKVHARETGYGMGRRTVWVISRPAAMPLAPIRRRARPSLRAIVIRLRTARGHGISYWTRTFLSFLIK